jgi:hypothetical protein
MSAEVRVRLLALTLVGFSALAQAPDLDVQVADDDGWTDAAPVDVPDLASTDLFETALAPYGEWLSINEQPVFRPSVGARFTPYFTNGHWVLSEAGWVFDSELPFAWATFHYGRWWRDPERGWLWRPGTQWGPSWVEWRVGGGFAAWAPLAPAGLEAQRTWVVVTMAHLCVPQLSSQAVVGDAARAALRSTHALPPQPGSGWHTGLAFADVKRASVVAVQHRTMTDFIPLTVATPGSVQGGQSWSADNAPYAPTTPSSASKDPRRPWPGSGAPPWPGSGAPPWPGANLKPVTPTPPMRYPVQRDPATRR